MNNTKTSKSAHAQSALLTGIATLSAAITVAGPATRSLADPAPDRNGSRPAQGVSVGPQELSAGPVRVKFADGELRYLYVGDHEIVRRIYFAVRNGKWATSTPVFSKISVKSQKGGFVIELAATCKSENVDYHWTGHITGTEDGTITFHAKGESGAAFQSNRLGICVLFGTPAVTGKTFVTSEEPAESAGGMTAKFPEFVQPTLVAPKFNRIRFDAPGDLPVSTAVTGTKFDMEDQRTYGDSSFKAYAPLKYDYPNIPANTAAEETVTISLPKLSKVEKSLPTRVVEVHAGKLIESAKIPKISVDATPAEHGDFGSVNGQQEKLKGKTELLWSYTTSTHLWDDDVLMENLHVLHDQVRSVHVFAPGAKITLNPVRINIHYKGEGEDPRGAEAFGVAWSMLAVKEMAIAGVDNAVFATGPGLGAKTQKLLGAFAGRHIYDLEVVDRPGVPRIEGFLIDESGKPGVGYLVNRSGDTIRVKLNGFAGAASRETQITLQPYSGVVLPH